MVLLSGRSQSVDPSQGQKLSSPLIFGERTKLQEQQRQQQERQQQEQLRVQKLNEKIQKFKARLDNLEITDESQIPEDVRPYITIPEGYFARVKDYKQKSAEYQEYEARAQAFKLAQKLYAKKVPASFVSGYEGEYLREMYRQGSLQKEQFYSDISKFRQQKQEELQMSLPELKMEEGRITFSTPSETFIFNQKNYALEGVESKRAGASLTPEGYESLTTSYRTTTPTEEKLQMSLPTNLRGLSPEEVASRQSLATGFESEKYRSSLPIEEFKRREKLQAPTLMEQEFGMSLPTSTRDLRTPTMKERLIGVAKKGGEVLEDIYYTKKRRTEIVPFVDEFGNFVSDTTGARGVLVEGGRISRPESAFQFAQNYLLPERVKDYLRERSPQRAKEDKIVNAMTALAIGNAFGLGSTTASSFKEFALGSESKILRGYKNILSVTFSEDISKGISKVSSFVPAEGVSAVFGKEVLASYVLTRRIPRAGLGNFAELIKEVIKDPIRTVKGFKQPEETRGEFIARQAGGFLGGSKNVQSYVEMGTRRLAGQTFFRVSVENIEGYGPVKFVDTGKYGKIAYVEGKFAQSEKLQTAEQLRLSSNVDRVVFTQSSPKAIPKGKLGVGEGFEVVETTKPLRGFYEAPPMKFIKEASKLQPDIPSEGSAITSYYLQAGGRERLIPTPKDILGLFTGETSLESTRPFVQLRRGSYPRLPKWISQSSESIGKGKGIPKTARSQVEKYYKKFLDEPYVTPDGRVLTGKDKLDLVVKINLKNKRVTPEAKKFYASQIQYQKEFGSQLTGGAEVLSGIQPYGPESQIVTGIGGKFYRRLFKDLRMGAKESPRETIIRFITGETRGQAFTKVGSDLIEFEFARFYPRSKTGKVKATKQPTASSFTQEIDNLLGMEQIERRLPSRRVRIPKTPQLIERAPPRTRPSRDILRNILRETVTRSRVPERRVRADTTNRQIQREIANILRPQRTTTRFEERRRSTPRPPIAPIRRIPPNVPRLPAQIRNLIDGTRDKRRKKKKGFPSEMNELLYLPDFTAKALQLEPQKVSTKQALKLLISPKSGFGLRFSAIPKVFK